MKKKMLLSIIIPVYNIEDYIQRCLDSCLAQNANSEYEIICVNDGSTDSSLKILREYENKYPNIIVIDKPNGGVSSARNMGINVARGEYIWFVDGDDWIAENSIDEIEKVLNNSDSKPDCVLFRHKKINTYNKPIISNSLCDSFEIKSGCADFEDTYTVGVCFRWFRKSCIDINNLFFDEKMKYAEDILFFAYFKCVCSKTLLIDENIYYYFQRETSAMHHLDAATHCINMFKLAKVYNAMEKTAQKSSDKKKMKISTIRAMQAACRDLCMYFSDFKTVRFVLKKIKKSGMYPYGVDWKQFKRDKRQSFKNDLLNWLFGFLSFEPYFWLCWFLCAIPFRSTRNSNYNINDFEDNY